MDKFSKSGRLSYVYKFPNSLGIGFFTYDSSTSIGFYQALELINEAEKDPLFVEWVDLELVESIKNELKLINRKSIIDKIINQ